jgi:hypothetical protein
LFWRKIYDGDNLTSDEFGGVVDTRNLSRRFFYSQVAEVDFQDVGRISGFWKFLGRYNCTYSDIYFAEVISGN